jgi:hypothetical protein
MWYSLVSTEWSGARIAKEFYKIPVRFQREKDNQENNVVGAE